MFKSPIQHRNVSELRHLDFRREEWGPLYKNLNTPLSSLLTSPTTTALQTVEESAYYKTKEAKCNEVTCQSCNEAAFATSRRTIEKVASSVRDST